MEKKQLTYKESLELWYKYTRPCSDNAYNKETFEWHWRNNRMHFKEDFEFLKNRKSEE